jgi:hypothetical protein
MRTIRISDTVWAAVAERGKFGETEDDVLRRVFGLPPEDAAQRARTPGGQLGRGGKRLATKRMSARVTDERLSVEIEGGNSRKFELPQDKSDKAGTKSARDAAHVYARSQGATQGQIDAITKALNEAGYYTRQPQRNSRSPLDIGL